jgi:hypothetical protein
MRQSFHQRMLAGLAVLLVGGVCMTSLAAQPPGKGKAPKRKLEPAPDTESVTVRGTVREFTTAPKGEVDGLMLKDGKWLHWPPHLESRFKSVAAKGDRVRAIGRWETDPEGETKLEVSTLTNLDTAKTAENPAFDNTPPTPGPRPVARGRGPDREQRLRDLEEQVDQLRREIKRLRREK